MLIIIFLCYIAGAEQRNHLSLSVCKALALKKHEVKVFCNVSITNVASEVPLLFEPIYVDRLSSIRGHLEAVSKRNLLFVRSLKPTVEVRDEPMFTATIN